MNILLNFAPLILLIGIWWFLWRRTRVFKGPAVASPGLQQVENLIALEKYDVDETGYWARMPWLSGLLFGVMMALFVFFESDDGGDSRLITAIITLVLGGFFFGLFMRVWVRGQARRLHAGLYSGDPRLIDPPPAEWQAYYRMPCRRIEGGKAFGGVLYIGRRGLLFVPHHRSRKPQRPLEIEPISAVEVSLVEPPARTHWGGCTFRVPFD